MYESKVRTAGPEVTARSKGIRVEIQKHCLEKMHGWCNAAKTEVSGYGLVRLINGVFHVREVFLPEQHCSPGFTLIKGESFARLQYYIDRVRAAKKKGFDPLNLDVESLDLRFWWHTHNDSDVFWSGTDDHEAQHVAEQNGEWSLSLVINKKGHRLCRTDIVKPIAVMVDELEITEVPNTGRVSKRNYGYDIKKWVKELENAKPKIAWPKRRSSFEPAKYVFHKGRMMTINEYVLAQECFCGDATCTDCKEILRAAGEETYRA